MPCSPWRRLRAILASCGLCACTQAPIDAPGGQAQSSWPAAVGDFSLMHMKLGMDDRQAKAALRGWLRLQADAQQAQTPGAQTAPSHPGRSGYIPQPHTRNQFRMDSGSRLWHYHAWMDAHQALPPVPLSAFFLLGWGKFRLRTDFNGHVRDTLHDQAVLTAKFTLAEPTHGQPPSRLYQLRYAVCPDTEQEVQRLKARVIELYGPPMLRTSRGPATRFGALFDLSGLGRTESWYWFFDARGVRDAQAPARVTQHKSPDWRATKSGIHLSVVHADVHNTQKDRCPRWDMDVGRKLAITLTDLEQAARDERLYWKFRGWEPPPALHTDIQRLERGWNSEPTSDAFNEYYSREEVFKR